MQHWGDHPVSACITQHWVRGIKRHITLATLWQAAGKAREAMVCLTHAIHLSHHAVQTVCKLGHLENFNVDDLSLQSAMGLRLSSTTITKCRLKDLGSKNYKISLYCPVKYHFFLNLNIIIKWFCPNTNAKAIHVYETKCSISNLE